MAGKISRRGFLKRAAELGGVAALGFWGYRKLEARGANAARNRKERDLRIDSLAKKLKGEGVANPNQWAVLDGILNIKFSDKADAAFVKRINALSSSHGVTPTRVLSTILMDYNQAELRSIQSKLDNPKKYGLSAEDRVHESNIIKIYNDMEIDGDRKALLNRLRKVPNISDALTTFIRAERK